MNISFSRNDPLNTLATDDSGIPLYEVNTASRTLGLGITTIRQVDVGGQSDIISQIDWRTIGDDRVNIPNAGEVWIKVKDFLPKFGMLTFSRTFVSPDGVEYRWKIAGDMLILINSTTQGVVAETKIEKVLVNEKERNIMSLKVNAEVESFLDTVFLTFVIMEKKRRDKSRSDSAFRSASSASAAGS